MKVAASGASVMLLGEVFPDRVIGQEATKAVRVTSYDRKRIADVADVKEGIPLPFDFPGEGLHSTCLLIKLGTIAGGGVGDDQDIVAFSGQCTHMGVDLTGGYVAEHHLLGCGEHLSTFDLTRHGIMVAGHATQSLPQIVLEIESGQIFASGIVGLIYGYSESPR